jgi:hypothetical protein
MVRMNKVFKNYVVLKGVIFGKFLGQEQNIDFKRRVLSFVANGVVEIDTPIIKNTEEQYQEFNNYDYFYNNEKISNGLACSDIWNTIAISFYSNNWNNPEIILKKETLNKVGDIEKFDIKIKHISSITHIKEHKNFLDSLNYEANLNISKNNFWENRFEYFPNIIKFCPEVKESIKKIDNVVFKLAITILREIELRDKTPLNYNWSDESNAVKNNLEMKKQRLFTINNEKVFFEYHIKSLPNANRIYFKEVDDKIYIGYIGKHLKTQRYK